MIGGSLLMGGIRSAMGGHSGGPGLRGVRVVAAAAAARTARPGAAAAAGIWRAKPVSTISAAAARLGGSDEGRRAGLFDSASNESEDDSDRR